MRTAAPTWVRHKRLAALCLQTPAVTSELFLAFLCLSSQVARGRLAMFSFCRWETEARKSPCLRYRGAHKGSPVEGGRQPRPVLWALLWLKITTACCCHGDWSCDSILQCCVYPWHPKQPISARESTSLLRGGLVSVEGRDHTISYLFLGPSAAKEQAAKTLSSVDFWLFTDN